MVVAGVDVVGFSKTIVLSRSLRIRSRMKDALRSFARSSVDDWREVETGLTLGRKKPARVYKKYRVSDS